MYSSLLVALDREDEGGARLLAARCKAHLMGGTAKLHLVHVRTPLPQSYLADLPRNWDVNDRSETEGWLRDFAQDNGLSGNLGGVHAPSGSIAREVIRLAADLRSEAILVAAHRLDLGRILLGTNTHAIARDAPCDVIVVRERPD